MTVVDVLFALLGLMLGFGLGLMQSRKRLEKIERELASASAYSAALKDQQQSLEKTEAQLKLEFENLANKIFDNMSNKFNVQSEKKLGDLLNPMRERLGDFQKLVVDSFSEQGKEQRSLKNEIERIVLSNDSLTKALRGDVKVQGNWGEVMLERILEESSLRKGMDYVLQGADMGLLSADGGRQMPDVIVHLPDGKHIIIDAKVSLLSYERYCAAAQGEEAQALCIREFLKSMKAHVNGLEQRRYQDNDKLGTPDFVLMFMPIEGAYALAMQQDRELHSYAWGKRVVIVCPTTLFATLQTIASLWKIERQNRNAQEIASEAGKMYDKFSDFVKDMDMIGNRLSQLQTSYDDAFSKLSKGRGNLISRAEKLKNLDIKTTKSLSVKSDEDMEDATVKLVAEG